MALLDRTYIDASIQLSILLGYIGTTWSYYGHELLLWYRWDKN